jgi:uncharacterized damage-inducible protein DinB
VTTLPDPFLTGAHDIYQTAFGEMLSALEGLSTDELNWTPDGPGFNSLATLTTHSLSSCRSWLCIAVGAPLPERDRDAELTGRASSAAALREWAQAVQHECMALLRGGARLRWDALRGTHPRPIADAPAEVTGAWALMHAIEHLREHLGQILLTRQLIDGRVSNP